MITYHDVGGKKMDFITKNFYVITQILTTFAIGGIITTYLAHHLAESTHVRNSDYEKFKIYKCLYFLTTKDPLNQDITLEEAAKYFTKFCNALFIYEDISLLLSTDMLNLLKAYYKKPSDSIVVLLQKQVERDFKPLRKKLGYFSSRTKGIFIYYFLFCLCILFILLTSIYILYFIYTITTGNIDFIYPILIVALIYYIITLIKYLKQQYFVIK